MKTIAIKSQGGTYEDCVLELNNYASNGNTAITIVSPTEGPICTLTVNIETLDKNLAAIDTNNYPFAEYLMYYYGLGEQVDFAHSGYCMYPVFKLDFKEINKYTVD